MNSENEAENAVWGTEIHFVEKRNRNHQIF